MLISLIQRKGEQNPVKLDKVGIKKRKGIKHTFQEGEKDKEMERVGKKTRRVGNGHSREWDIVDFSCS